MGTNINSAIDPWLEYRSRKRIVLVLLIATVLVGAGVKLVLLRWALPLVVQHTNLAILLWAIPFVVGCQSSLTGDFRFRPPVIERQLRRCCDSYATDQ
jgi:hypothetical protein